MTTTNNTNQTVPGMYYPQTSGMLAGNPRDSSMQLMNATNMKQASLNSAVGGKRKNGGAIVVPQFQTLYQTGPNGPNQIIASNLATSTQSRANAVGDAAALQKGGYKNKKGGNSDWIWGCYSGGKKYKTKRSKHLKKTKNIRHLKKNKKTKRNY